MKNDGSTHTKDPLVSIVVCTRNRASYIGETLATIRAQEYRPVELIVVDDGSTDTTAAVVAASGDDILYHRQERQGIAAARTAGCRLARGEYIAFQDDDDLMPPSRITSLLGALRRHDAAVLAVGDWELIDPQGGRTGRRSRFEAASGDREVVIADGYRAVLWPLVTPLPHTTLFRRADGERIGWFDSARFFHACSDTDFFARLGSLGAVVYLPEVVSYYRMGHAQIWGNRVLSEYSRFLLFEKHLLFPGTDAAGVRARLRARLLATMEEMDGLLRRDEPLPEQVPADYSARGLSLLDPGRRIAYYWRLLIRRPFGRWLRRAVAARPGKAVS